MRRLRSETGHDRYVTQAQIDSKDMTPAKIMSQILWRPVVLCFEPTLLVYNTYLALIYGKSSVFLSGSSRSIHANFCTGLLYLWFESFPLIFVGVHGFDPGELGLA